MSIWAPFGTSDFPLNQPMVGQKEFYDIFKGFTKSMKTAGMATIFPLISKWGVGKSRIGFEIIAEPLGMDKGWIINDDGEQKEVRIFKPNFEDKVLSLYIRYSQMYHQDINGDHWVGYGIYTALSYLSKESDGSIQGKTMECIQDALSPIGFDRTVLANILEVGNLNIDDLVINSNKLDSLTRKGIEYIKKFNIEHILIVCDEIETAGEIAKYGIKKDKELQSKVEGEAIEVITSAIKHEDPRKKYSEVSFLLLCSTVIGGSIQGIGALDRRTEMYEMFQNSFADISDFIEYLNTKVMVPHYPDGLIEAAYTIAGGNFGWFNVIMHNVDQKMDDDSIKKDTGCIFENILNSSNRFKESLIDKPSFDYIQCEEKHRQAIKYALLKQIPYKKTSYTEEEIKSMFESKAEDGETLFKEFYCIKLKKEQLGNYMVTQGYNRDLGENFVNNLGKNFDLGILLRSLKTFSINVKENEFIVGKQEETFLDQVRMLYPKEEIEEVARYIYSYIIESIEKEDEKEAGYIGPNFAYLNRLDKRYRMDKNNLGYVSDTEKNKEIEKLVSERSQIKKEEVKRIITGACRALEINYPEEQHYDINGVKCVRVKVENGPYLDVSGDKIVDIIWGKDEEKLKDALLDSKLLKDGVHPIIVISDSVFSAQLSEKFVKDKYDGIGKCLIFINITRLQKSNLEVMSVDKDKMDIRENRGMITSTFRQRIREIRDHFSLKSKEWFDKLDSEGWILRPIIYKKCDDKQIVYVAEAFERMLINGLDFEELGSKKGVKLPDAEYTEVKNILKYSGIGKMNERPGYHETGLFIKQDENNYTIAIPSCMNRILSFNGSNNKSINNYEDKFFFSLIKEVKPKKIVEQWLLFMMKINLLRKTETGFIERISKYELDGKYNLVKKWLEDDCKKEITYLKNEIKSKYFDLLEEKELPDLKVKLLQAESIKNNINIQKLTEKDKDTYVNFKESISNVRTFMDTCNLIFDKEGWNSIKEYNSNVIKNIKIVDDENPIWYRLKHIRLFINYINNLKEPAVKCINDKIGDVLNSCMYKGHMIPISPIKNILQKCCDELANPLDYVKYTSTNTITMVNYTKTLPHKLLSGDLSGAHGRIEELFDICGLEPIENFNFKWSTESGASGKYKNIYKEFTSIIDMYEKLPEAEKWASYFEDAPDTLKTFADIKSLSNCVREMNLFVNGGLEQEIEDVESSMLSTPDEFVELLKKRINEMVEHAKPNGLIEGYKLNVMNFARTKRNECYDNLLLKTLDKIRKGQGKPPASIEINMEEYPKEKTYGVSKKNVDSKRNELVDEGETFFKQNARIKKATFSFFMDIVDKNGEIEWESCLEEKKELEGVRLIRTKVEVL